MQIQKFNYSKHGCNLVTEAAVKGHWSLINGTHIRRRLHNLSPFITENDVFTGHAFATPP
jgi:hypothetical protein